MYAGTVWQILGGMGDHTRGKYSCTECSQDDVAILKYYVLWVYYEDIDKNYCIGFKREIFRQYVMKGEFGKRNNRLSTFFD